jgi:Family of unknown function (DUF6188)
MLSVMARPLDLLIGQKLEFVRLDHTIVLSFSRGAQVVVESVAELTTPTGRFVVDPGAATSDVVAILLGDVIREARTGDGGGLELTFASGAELHVEADADFESWAVAGPDGFLIVSLARGELAVWEK